MTELYHYKLWRSELGQYVAQRGRLPADDIRDLGGLVIVEGAGGTLPGRAATGMAMPPQAGFEHAAAGR